jgi:zinc protease
VQRWARPQSFAALLLAVALLCSQAGAVFAAPVSESDVLKATLHNGLRVVLVRNTIAPAVSVNVTYLVGSRDDPADVPGMAHAQEHMMFRGTKNLSTSELGTLATALGGDFNAETSDTVTQFQFTVPAADLDAVFHIEADRMRDILDAQSQWENERGAIEQEVLRDESAPGADFFREAEARLMAGTPYEHAGVGTRAAFDRLTGPQLKAFYERWYAPNNALLVLAGDIDLERTLADIRTYFDAIPQRSVPAHAVAHLRPFERVVLRRPTTLVYPLALVGFRLPGVDSPDFLASFLLQEVLDSARGPLHALADRGDALDGEWVQMPYVPEVQLGYAAAALRPGGDPSAMAGRLETILSDYAEHGVPRELFESTRRRAIAEQELSRNSISALASDWATTIAVDNEPSIAHEQELLGGVTLEEVNRVAKRYLDPRHAIVGALTPSAGASQNQAPTAPQTGRENPLAAQPPVTHLPAWAEALVANISAPPARQAPSRTKLANGIDLIVEPESISDSVFVFGSVRTNPALQEPPGREGVSSVLGGLYEQGTRTQDRATFQRALDDADTEISAGSEFGAQTVSKSFERAIALLSENVLAPRFDQASFDLAKRRVVDELATSLNGASAYATRQTEEKLLPPGDPELRQPSVAGLQALTLDDVRAYYDKTMRPDLTTIVVVGNVTPAAAAAAIERAFGAWHASGPAPVLDLPALTLNQPGSVKLTLPSLGQDDVQFQQILTVPNRSPDSYGLQLGDAILGGGALGPEQSRLFRDLRQNAGLVYSVASRITQRPGRSRFSVEFACLPSNEGRISQLIDAEIQRMRSEPAGDFELTLAKASMVRRTIVSDASIASIGSALLSNGSHALPLDQARLDAQQLLATDAKAVQQAFASYVHPENFVRVLVGP